MTGPAALAAYRGQTVLVTGHTGFKGGWLSLWLRQLGARVVGCALPPETEPSLCAALDLPALVEHHELDIQDPAALAALVEQTAPAVVFHLAAQPIVRRSYRTPLETLATNVMGTAHLLEAARRVPSVRAVVIVTSDKCYDNREWVWGYRENDAMGGADPYSCSKGAAELVTAAWRRSFFAGAEHARVASVRAGNVIGGGDWAEDRLIPDLVRAATAGQPVAIRNPDAVRPWQHVLEPLAGYLLLGARLQDADGAGLAEGWNFGPEPQGIVDVRRLVGLARTHWGEAAPRIQLAAAGPAPHEARGLRLDITKATARLGWRPLLDLEQTVGWTVDWYRDFRTAPAEARGLTERQIERYTALWQAAAAQAA